MRLERIDVLRGIAILLVVGHHMPINSGAFMLWRHVGWIGVDLFFVLSGFLVSGLLFAEYQRHGTLSIARFLARRGLKIYPSFYTLLSLTVAYYAFVTSGWVAPRTPLPDLAARATAEAVYLGNYLPSVWGHTWSLAVEEHFYFMLAGGFVLLVRYRRANPFAALVPIVALTVLGVTALRVFTWANYPYTFKTHLSVTHLRFDALAIGVLLSYAYHYHREALLASVLRWRYALAVAAALLIATPFAWADGALAPFGLLSFSLGFAVVLALTLTRTQRPPLAGRVIATVGVYSYSIYLWHPAVERMVARLSLSAL